jgi:hypothetical protein
MCRHGCAVAHLRVELSAGCACFPDDLVQDLCIQHWIKLEPLGSAKVVLVLDQELAKHLLQEKFYEWVPAPWDPGEKVARFRRDSGELVDPAKVPLEELKARRDSWLGKGFKFEWSVLPPGAKYV